MRDPAYFSLEILGESGASLFHTLPEKYLCSTYLCTDALDCYDTPNMLILVFIEFRENQEW